VNFRLRLEALQRLAWAISKVLCVENGRRHGDAPFSQLTIAAAHGSQRGVQGVSQQAAATLHC
jgi:hypothetical protein